MSKSLSRFLLRYPTVITTGCPRILPKYMRLVRSNRRTICTSQLCRHPGEKAPANISAADLEKCSGCGVEFHQEQSHRAGYLPQLQDRKAAFRMGLSYEDYKLRVLDEESEGRRARRLELERIASISGDTLPSSSTLSGDDLESSRYPESLVCTRCHSLQNHRRLPSSDMVDFDDSWNQERALEVQQRVIKRISKETGGLAVVIADILDFPNSVNVDLVRGLGVKPVILVVNKIDLLPGVDKSPEVYGNLKKYLDNFVRSELQLKNVVDVHAVSAQSQTGLSGLIKSLVTHKAPLDDIFIIGSINSGKSTLLNAFNRHLDGPNHRKSTTSFLAGTTIDEISIPIHKFPKIRDYVQSSKGTIIKARQNLLATLKSDESGSDDVLVKGRTSIKSSSINKLLHGNIIDTPGVPSRQLASLLRDKELARAVPSQSFKPISYFLRPGRSMWIGGLARIDYVEGSAQVIATNFIDNRIPVHTSNILKAEWLWNTHAGGKSKNWEETLIMPTPAQIERMDDKIKVVRKNVNKDIHVGMELAPPFFSDAEEYVRSYIDIQKRISTGMELDDKERTPSGILYDRMKEYPHFKLNFTHEFTNAKPPAYHGYSKLHFDKSIADIVLGGIGWLSIAGNFSDTDGRKALFKVYTPGGHGAYIRYPSISPLEVAKRGKKIAGHSDGMYAPSKSIKSYYRN